MGDIVSYYEEHGSVEGEARVAGGKRKPRIPESASEARGRAALRVCHVFQQTFVERLIAHYARARARVRLAHRQEARAQAANRELAHFGEKLINIETCNV